jgi:hypothetical protein
LVPSAGKGVLDAAEGRLQGGSLRSAARTIPAFRVRRIAYLIVEAGAQHSQSPAIAEGPLGDAASLLSQLGSCRSILLTPGSYFDASQAGILRPNCCLRQKGPYLVDNQRFISAARRNRPASPSASLRRCPNDILRTSAITSVARASQSWLWADGANMRLTGELIMMLPE